MNKSLRCVLEGLPGQGPVSWTHETYRQGRAAAWRSSGHPCSLCRGTGGVCEGHCVSLCLTAMGFGLLAMNVWDPLERARRTPEAGKSLECVARAGSMAQQPQLRLRAIFAIYSSVIKCSVSHYGQQIGPRASSEGHSGYTAFL